MSLCSFLNCPSRNIDANAVNFFAFPFGNSKLFREWVAAVDRPNWLPTKNDYICEYHFPGSCFIDSTLKDDAVPESSINSSIINDKVYLDESLIDLVCRLCGKQNAMKMTKIFDNDHQILEKISTCLPLIIQQSDELPKQICYECHTNLDVSYSLIQNSLVTEQKMKNLLSMYYKKRERFKVQKLPLNGPIDCDICGVHFKDMSRFDEHIEKHKEEIKESQYNANVILTCTKCGYLFKKKDDYDTHKMKFQKECPRCKMVVHSICSFNIHECPEKFCGMYNIAFQSLIFLSDRLKKAHNIQIDPSGKGALCERCKQVLTIDKLKAHSCKVSIYSSDDSLGISKFDIEGKADTRVFCCNKCGSTFESVKNMIEHDKYHRMAENNRVENPDCNLCETSFSQSKGESHCKGHGSQRTAWTCRYCGKSTTTKLSLNIHERIHSGIKPFICEWCGNEFRSRANLMQHQVVHTGVRNHACPRCGKKFSRKSFVKTHMRVHTGERPFCCEICGQRFTQVGDMKRHRNRHHRVSTSSGVLSIKSEPSLNGEKQSILAKIKKKINVLSAAANTDISYQF